MFMTFHVVKVALAQSTIAPNITCVPGLNIGAMIAGLWNGFAHTELVIPTQTNGGRLPHLNGFMDAMDAARRNIMTEKRMFEKQAWTITLDDYQRNNLLRMLNSFGAPYGNPWHNTELSQLVSVDTGDWFGEVAYLLGGVLEPGESVYGCRPPEPGFMVKRLQDEIERLKAERDDHKARLAIEAVTVPDADYDVMMDSLQARLGDLHAEIERLRQWKAEASTVLKQWHQIADDIISQLDADDCLGRRLPDIVDEEVARLRALTAEQALIHDAWLTERDLADRLADALADHMRGEDHPAYTAWEESRRNQE